MYQRNISTNIVTAMADTPVVLVSGPRQSGKSTLVEWIGSRLNRNATFSTLDNVQTLSAIKADPSGFVKRVDGWTTILDEVQKAPELFVAIKEAVDKNRQPGRFLLTGSANIFLLPKISESLAGRMEMISLWPLSQGEIRGVKEKFIDSVFGKTLPVFKPEHMIREELFKNILLGGFPEVLTRLTFPRRQAWFESYITAILQRDVRDIMNIEDVTALPRLLSLLAARSCSLLNYAELARTSGIPHTTLMRYLILLQATFLVHVVLPWSGNFSKRLVKSPKIYLCDTGLMSFLLSIDEARLELEPNFIGLLLENFVVNELKKQLTWNETRAKLFHYRTQSGQEVDIIIENARGECVGIEVKASTNITEKDFAGLQVFSEHIKNKFIWGIVLYTGEKILPFGKNLYALPISSLWSLT